MERKYFFQEERRFYDRAKADRLVGGWAAARMGMNAHDAEDYAERAVEAGVASKDGRGGFLFIASQIAKIGVHLEELRTRYDIMGNGDCPAIGLFVPVELSRRA